MKAIRILETSDKLEFEILGTQLAAQGFEILSSTCSMDKDGTPCYQAILWHEDVVAELRSRHQAIERKAEARRSKDGN